MFNNSFLLFSNSRPFGAGKGETTKTAKKKTRHKLFMKLVYQRTNVRTLDDTNNDDSRANQCQV